MKVELIDYTGIGNPNKRHAAELLVFTKSTRLNLTPSLKTEIKNWSDDKIMKELEYMSNTIPSSWEFVDYTFLVNKCTRAFTHQLVRNRYGSYAQQTMRIIEMDDFTYETTGTIETIQELYEIYHDIMADINQAYKNLIKLGAKPEDARGALPTNIHTNIICKFNLRTLAEIAIKRSSPRTQGEYRIFLDKFVDCVLKVHPWARLFMRNKKYEAAKKLDEFIQKNGGDVDMLKMVDILRG